jgi:hypothetical protein
MSSIFDYLRMASLHKTATGNGITCGAFIDGGSKNLKHMRSKNCIIHDSTAIWKQSSTKASAQQALPWLSSHETLPTTQHAAAETLAESASQASGTNVDAHVAHELLSLAVVHHQAVRVRIVVGLERR